MFAVSLIPINANSNAKIIEKANEVPSDWQKWPHN